ncbi:hypothetical protein BDV96DRAFT_507567 [Lophiotrema nucula]|uniref:DUF1996 domain-containing protein n=1 Tax=Lophiotrema nucula TaxID=690887 RepID=A0A6A5YHS4_9PLEO|nr:hypothetical protein BDV96DRAFT_507567 [Lophiotrema nucula]
MKSIAKLAAAVGALSGAADAFWRMDCHSRTGLVRLDPLVEPDEISSHAHVVHGGSNFGMQATYDDLLESDCTSCLAKEDKSAYWTPSLHFIHSNGKAEIVPQVGGMLSYYLLYGQDIKAFPAGFRMLAGDTRLRNFSGPVPDPPTSEWGPEDKTQHALAQKSLGFNCLNYAKTPEGSMYRHFLPTKDYMDANCAQGIRAEIFFPSCWDGKNLDSTNHKDHMRYPDLGKDGTCPEGFETRLPSLFYETIWDTAAFAGVGGEFMWANGDPTGYGYHGDFITGWDVDLLQSAVNDCTDPSGELTACSHFTLQTQDDVAQCKLSPKQSIADVFSLAQDGDEKDCVESADGLCGNVPIQRGPGYASAIKGSGDDSTPTAVYTPPAASEISSDAAVPTLSYQAPKSAITDDYGGGISVQAVNNGNAAPSQPSEVNAAEAPATTTSSSSAVVPAAPAPTSAPEVPAPADGGSIISTTTYTSAGTVYEVAIKEVNVYVTVEPPAVRRRHNHHHLHRKDREHGLLGRRF